VVALIVKQHRNAVGDEDGKRETSNVGQYRVGFREWFERSPGLAASIRLACPGECGTVDLLGADQVMRIDGAPFADVSAAPGSQGRFTASEPAVAVTCVGHDGYGDSQPFECPEVQHGISAAL